MHSGITLVGNLVALFVFASVHAQCLLLLDDPIDVRVEIVSAVPTRRDFGGSSSAVPMEWHQLHHDLALVFAGLHDRLRQLFLLLSC